MANVGYAVVQGCDQPFASARNGQHAEVEPLTREVAFALCHEKRERKDALQRRIGLRVTKRNALGARALTGAKPHQPAIRLRFKVTSAQIPD
jgi:hypothetical protein